MYKLGGAFLAVIGKCAENGHCLFVKCGRIREYRIGNVTLLMQLAKNVVDFLRASSHVHRLLLLLLLSYEPLHFVVNNENGQ